MSAALSRVRPRIEGFHLKQSGLMLPSSIAEAVNPQ